MDKIKIKKIEKRLEEIWQYRDSLLAKKHLEKVNLTDEEESVLLEYNELMNLLEKERESDIMKKNRKELSELLERCKKL